MPDRRSSNHSRRAGVPHTGIPALAHRESEGVRRPSAVRLGIRVLRWCFGLGVLATALVHLSDPSGVGRPLCGLLGELASVPCTPLAIGRGLVLLLFVTGLGSLVAPARPALAIQASLLTTALSYHVLHGLLDLGSSSCGCATSAIVLWRDQAHSATTMLLSIATVGVATHWYLLNRRAYCSARRRSLAPLLAGTLVLFIGALVVSGLIGNPEPALTIEVSAESAHPDVAYPRVTVVHATDKQERVVDGVHDPHVLAARLSVALRADDAFRVDVRRAAETVVVSLHRVRWHRASPQLPQISIAQSLAPERVRITYASGGRQINPGIRGILANRTASDSQ